MFGRRAKLQGNNKWHIEGLTASSEPNTSIMKRRTVGGKGDCIPECIRLYFSTWFVSDIAVICRPNMSLNLGLDKLHLHMSGEDSVEE